MKHTPFLALLLVACGSSTPPPRNDPPSSRLTPGAFAGSHSGASTPGGTSANPTNPVSATTAPPAVPDPPLEWGTRGGAGPLYPIVDGICIHGKVFPVENGAIFAYGMETGSWSRGGTTTAQFVTEVGLVPQANQGFGKSLSTNVGFVGGKYPDRMFAIFDVSSRMVQASELYIGRGAERTEWKVAIESGARWSDAGNAAATGEPVRVLGMPLVLADGSYLVPLQSQTESKSTYSFRLIKNDGTLAPASAKVPGPDLAEIAFRGMVATLANGEVVGVPNDKTATKLVRWSPTRKVNDVAFAKPAQSLPRLAAGKKRAYVEIDGGIFAYDAGGDTLAPVKSNARLAKGFKWSVGPDDELIVIQSSKVLLEEKPSGDVREEQLPIAGALFGAAQGAFWMVASASTEGGSDALYRRVEKGWESVPLPAPPFGTDQRSPLKVEGVDVVAKDDVFVNVRRVEKGFGWKAPEPFRAVYRTKKPKEVMRCQDVRSWQNTGVGLWSWAPAADETCKNILVVVVQEQSGKPSADYPNLRAKLKGKTDFGETLSFVNFDGRGGSNLGIAMTDLAKAKALATYASSSLDLRAEVSCGKPTPTRSFTFDVAKGTFAF